jgi:hypothetical protein
MKRKVLFAIAAFFCFFMVNAQAQSNFRYYIDSDAMEYIGKMAHPAQTILGSEITRSSSSSIDINIRFESLMRSYWEPYRINLRTYNGVPYVYSIVRTRAVSIYEPFLAIDVLSSVFRNIARWAGYSVSDSADAIRALYGVSESELSKEQKAAIMLMNYLFPSNE